VAGGCTVLAILAVVAAVFAYFNSQRARRAERAAEETRTMAEQARGQAEQLLGYLSDDFARELESFGRINVLADFAQRQIDYFRALPAALKSAQSTRNGALALVHHARALRWLGDLKGAGANAEEAVQLLGRLRDTGDHSEATAIALGLAYVIQAQILDNKNDAGGPAAAQRAAALLQPLAEAPHASVAAKGAYVEALVRIGYEGLYANQYVETVRAEREAQSIASALGGRDLSDLSMGAYYAEAGGWLVTGLFSLGQTSAAKQAGEDSVAVADQVLERRPGYRLALHAQQVILGGLSRATQDELDPAEGLRVALREEQVSLTLLKLDPNNVTSINNLAVARGDIGDVLWESGRLHEAMPHYRQQVEDIARATAGGTTFFMTLAYTACGTAYRNAELGDSAAASATLAAAAPYLAKLRQSEGPGSMAVAIADAIGRICEAAVAFEKDDMSAARRIAADAVTHLQAATPHGAAQEYQKHISLWLGQHVQGRAEYQLNDFAAAERSERKALEARSASSGDAIGDRRDKGELSTWIAMAIARQGRLEEAAQTIAPVVRFQRELAARNHGDRWQPLELASALYAQALSDPKRSPALLREAALLLAGLAPELHSVYDVRQWRMRIQTAQQGRLAENGASQTVRSSE
jgi:hypothetical protein